MQFAKRDLISIEDFSNEEIEEIFSIANEMDTIINTKGRSDIGYGKILATLFFEPSTRTRFSFEAAIQRLGGGLISAPDMSVSSTKKGETLPDTVKTISQYADVIVIRHPLDGAAKVAAEFASIPVINAGDGKHEHPTQTLLDLYTLIKEKGKIKGLTVALCGDLKYARSIHSLAYGLARFGADIVCMPAKRHQIPDYVSRRLGSVYGKRPWIAPEPDIKVLKDKIDSIFLTPSHEQLELPYPMDLTLYFTDSLKKKVTDSVPEIDAFYITRIQTERFAGSDRAVKPVEDYPVINGEFLKEKKFSKTIVMHPLPRVDELSTEVDDDKRAIYFRQAAYGVPVRMAVIAFLLGLKKIKARKGRTDDNQSSPKRETDHIACENQDCILNHEKRILNPKFKFIRRERINRLHVLIYRCMYCDMEVLVPYVGNFTGKRYTKFHPSLSKRIELWRNTGNLIVFDSEETARQAGYKQYKPGRGRFIYNEKKMQKGLLSIADKIIKSENLADSIFLGIDNQGRVIAERISTLIKEKTNIKIPVASLNVDYYRDDRSFIDNYEGQRVEKLPSVEDKTVILVDDVISTGRTARSALEAIIDKKIGRPRKIKFMVIINVANARELPINPDFFIKEIKFRENKLIKVRLKETDDIDEAVEYSATDNSA